MNKNTHKSTAKKLEGGAGKIYGKATGNKVTQAKGQSLRIVGGAQKANIKANGNTK